MNAPTAAAPTPSLTQKLDELFKPWNRSDEPGLTVGVAHRGRVIYRRAFGLASIEHARSLSPATRMRIGSTTKHFCCLGIMLLAEDGKLDIGKPVRSYLPELAGVAGEPTLLQLMQHTGGISDPMVGLFLFNGGSYGQLPPGGTLDLIQRMTERNFAPGSRFAYSNAGYTLLTLVTERIGGQKWEAFMAERVFGPLGMSATTLLRSDLDIVPDVATFHFRDTAGQWRRGVYPSDELLGSGGMISTVDDMLAWTAHLRGARKTVGSAATWARMIERQRFPSGETMGYGLGLMTEKHRGVDLIHHAGATLGAQSQMLTAPAHELDIIVLTNRMDASAPALALSVLETVLEGDGLGLGPRELPAAAEQYPTVQGRWFSAASRTLMEIAPKKLKPDLPEQLALSVYNQLTQTLRVAGEGLAAPESAYSKYEFRRLPSAEPGAALEVHICGDLERFERLPDTPPTAEALAPELCGRYRHAGTGKDVELRLRDGKLWLDLLPYCGRGEWEIAVVSDSLLGCGVLHTLPPFPLPNPAVLTIERKGGKVAGFWFDTDRVRNLYFDRR